MDLWVTVKTGRSRSDFPWKGQRAGGGGSIQEVRGEEEEKSVLSPGGAKVRGHEG